MSRTKVISLKNNKLLPILVVNAILIVMVLMRPFFCIAVLDEAFNLGQAFRTVQGNVFLVENWDTFQTGDSFMSIFLLIFYKITGSTQGIVLYSRIVFIFLQTGLSVLVYKVLTHFFDRISVFFSVLVFETAVAFLIFNMWYDNWEVFFRIIGLILILFVICSSDDLSSFKKHLHVFIAGIAHACMVFAYPTMIPVFIYILGVLLFYSRKLSLKERVFSFLSYFFGAGSVFFIFLLYAFKVGVNNLFIFNSSFSSTGGSPVGREGFFSLPDIILKIKLLFLDNLICYAPALIVFVIDLVILYVFRKSKSRVLYFSVVMIFGYLIQLISNFTGSGCLNMLMAYTSLYVFPMYYLLNDSGGKKTIFKKIMFIFVIPSYISGLAYSLTAQNGALKFAYGTRPCAIFAVLMLFEVLKQSEIKIDRRLIFSLLATTMAALNVFTMYALSFEGSKPLECNTLVTSGIYKGLIDTSENARRYEVVGKDLAEVIIDSDKTITCGPFAMEFYLMSDLKPDAAALWSPSNTDLLFQYYKIYYGEPDIIVLHDSADDVTNEVFLEFVDSNYKLAKYTDGYFIYRHK